ncbi:FAD-binding oxidoreductase [Streptomyces albus subsp. chlorinus]|uniref:FAD-binding oxidoreductase n=1 Tax=Streptomyces albus TaxID=1888 RepID=UPI0031F6492D
MIRRRSLLRAGAGAAGLGLVGAGGYDALGVAGRPGTAARQVPWDRLRKALRGDLVLPGEPDYTRAKQLALAQFDSVSPQGVAYCTTALDVAACLRFAQEHGLRTATRSGGHSYGGYSTTQGLVIDVSRMNRVRPGERTVRLGPGAQSVDVMTALSPHNLQVVSGLCPTVCPGGYLLGGGIGFQTRKFGLGSDRLVSAEIVLADGRVVRTSANEEPDLFWALRGGGGGNFGIVTDFEVLPTRVPTMNNFTLVWQADHFPEAAAAWQSWIDEAGNDLACSLGVMIDDSKPDTVPQVLVTGSHLGKAEVLREALDALVSAVGRPPSGRQETGELPYAKAMMQTFGCADYSTEECHRQGGTPEGRIPRERFVLDRNRLASEPLSGSAVADLFAAHQADRRPGQMRYLNLMALGGRANEPGRTETAYVHRDTRLFVGYSVGLSADHAGEEDQRAARAWIDRAFDALTPHSNGEAYQNFIDPALGSWESAYYAENYERLRKVRRHYDPDHFFRFPQAIA